MNTTIGTGMTSIGTTTSTTSSRQLYYGRWVSPPMFGGPPASISANTWTYNFSASEAGTASNFPVNGTNQVVRVNCYVWRPSTSAKIGTILDGNTAATVDEAGSNVNRAQQTTFTGVGVSSLANGDVIIFEAWFIITSGTTTAQAKNFFFDGTTVTTTESTVTNHASFIETPQTLNLTAPLHFDRTAGESLTVSADPVKRLRAIRPLPSNTLTIADTVVRKQNARRIITGNTLTVAANGAKAWRTVRTAADSFTIVGNVVGEKAFGRSVTESISIQVDVARKADLARLLLESLTLTVNAAYKRRVLSLLTETIAVTANGAKVKRFVRTAVNSLTIADAVSRLYRGRKGLPSEPITITAVGVRLLRARRTAAATAALTATVIWRKRAIRPISESVNINAAVVRVAKARRSLAESAIIGAETVRRLRGFRLIGQSFSLAATGIGAVPISVQRIVNDSLTVVSGVTKKRIVPRPILASIAAMTGALEKLCRAEEEED